MSSQPNQKPILLVVDDEPEIREIIAFCAQDLGFHVLEAGDGAQALDVVRKQHIDIICSDLMMPRVTGITFLSHLRDEGRNQPFILLTAYPSQDSTIQALRLGAFDYIEKPFDTEELKNLLQEALRVSSEFQKIDPAAKTAKPNDSMAQEDITSNLNDAVQVINRLKALRYSNDKTTHQGEDDRKKVLELFITEATPQLVFCDAAIKNLAHQENRAFELGYLFRVMQTISQAAMAIDEDAVADFAKKAEYFFTALRVQPRLINDRLIELAAHANEKLRYAISTLGDQSLPEDFDEIKNQLAIETQKITGLPAA